VAWLSDPSTGVFDNATGVPSWVLPIAVYQSADIGLNGSALPWPVFPGLPANATRDQCWPAPAWPAWARPWVASKNLTRLVVPPGSLLEAERAAKLASGVKWDSAQAKLEAKIRMGLDEAAPELPDPSHAEEETVAAGAGGAAPRLAPELLAESPEERAGNRSAAVVNPGVTPLPLRIVPNRGAEVRRTPCLAAAPGCGAKRTGLLAHLALILCVVAGHGIFDFDYRSLRRPARRHAVHARAPPVLVRAPRMGRLAAARCALRAVMILTHSLPLHSWRWMSAGTR
jgi:hypothetical protein